MIKAVERLLPGARPVGMMGSLARAPKTFDIQGRRFDVAEFASDFLRSPVTLTPLNNDGRRFFSTRLKNTSSLVEETSPVCLIGAEVRTLDGGIRALPGSVGDDPTKCVDLPSFGLADELLYRLQKRSTIGHFMPNTHMDVWCMKESNKIPVNWVCVWAGISGPTEKMAVINLANVFMIGSEPFMVSEERRISLNVQACLEDAATHPFSVDLMLRLPGEMHSLYGMVAKIKPVSLRVGGTFYASTESDVRFPFWAEMFPRLFDISPYEAFDGSHAVSISKMSPDGSFLSTRQSVMIGRSFFEPEKTGYLWTFE